MRRTGLGLLVSFVLLAMLLAGCAASEPAVSDSPEGSGSGAAALQVTGSVESPVSWTEDQVKAMDTVTVESTNKDGETVEYTGVLISELLASAKPAADAATVAFVADDGYTAETALADVMSCADCIVSFRSQGGFSTVLPGQSGGLQVKGVIELQVK